jgi:Flp pilus assembly pilin Flp
MANESTGGREMLRQVQDEMARLRAEEEGAAMTEYAIVVAGIAVVAIIAVQAVGTAIVGVFNDIITAITSM